MNSTRLGSVTSPCRPESVGRFSRNSLKGETLPSRNQSLLRAETCDGCFLGDCRAHARGARLLLQVTSALLSEMIPEISNSWNPCFSGCDLTSGLVPKLGHLKGFHILIAHLSVIIPRRLQLLALLAVSAALHAPFGRNSIYPRLFFVLLCKFFSLRGSRLFASI